MPTGPSYALLDCGNGRRLERFGRVVTDRPAPVATWAPALPHADWSAATLAFDRATGWSGTAPDDWTVEVAGVRMALRPSPAGQVGVFPEHAEHWARILAAVRGAGRPIAVLNAFGYTGGGTIAACSPGVEACHVDASASAVAWARRNAELNGLAGHPVRWIVDDVTKFLRREARRGRRYDAVVLDPPAFGRGKGGATWLLERDLPPLVDAVAEVLSPAPLFVLLTAHPPGWSPDDLAAFLGRAPFAGRGRVEAGATMLRADGGGNPLPCGLWAWWGRS